MLLLGVCTERAIDLDRRAVNGSIQVAQSVYVRRPEDLSEEHRHKGELVLQSLPEVSMVCLPAQAFPRLMRTRNAEALEP